MSHVDHDPLVRLAMEGREPTHRRHGEQPSAFFWWIRALLAATGAVAVFPVFFALAVRVLHSLPA